MTKHDFLHGSDSKGLALSKETLEKAIARFKEFVDVPYESPQSYLVVSPTHFPKPYAYRIWGKKKRLQWLKYWRAPLIILWRWEKEGLL